MADRRRLLLRNFLSPEICKELEFIHKSCCTVGYRPNVFSSTLSHLIATNSPHLILPFVPIREKLREKVEEYFGCEYELFVEFTGLISWCKGASIGWHSDDNRDHLKQRDFSAVCYLNNYEVDFRGGLFHFQDGDPSTIAPSAGDVVIYTADDRNIHSVSEITEGERITLALWFSRDASHDEDTKLLKSLSNCSLNSHISSIAQCYPMLASSNMYWFPPEETSRFQIGFNICFARLYLLGFDAHLSDKSDQECQLVERDSSSKTMKLLEEPLCLSCGDELLSVEFANILHALQVMQFYNWKALETEAFERRGTPVDVVPLSELHHLRRNSLKNLLLKDVSLAKTLLQSPNCRSSQRTFDRFHFSSVVSEWEAYTLNLCNKLVLNLPYWQTHQSIFCVGNLD